MQRLPDLSDRRLRLSTALAVFAVAVWFLLRPALAPVWSTPGSPELYLVGVAGAALLLVPIAFALAKRGGRGRNPVGWFRAHVYCSLAGAVLIAVHSAGHLRRAPALLLLGIVVLAVLGIWARVRGSRAMAATFASKQPAFPAPDAAARERLRAIIERKQALLGSLQPGAREATFSVSLPHLLRAPRLALAYQRLAREESELLATRRAVGLAQAWWRPLHMTIAWVFALGVLTHVLTVTFFAGYVADGGPIGWWHLTAW